MVNNGSRNSNNSDNNDVENLSSTLEHLLIVQAQLLQTVQQVMVQMQEVNQLMQSMEVRASSRKRKSNTQDDVDQAQKMSAVEKAATQNPKGKKCYNYGQKGHFALQCRNPHTRPPRTLSSTLAPSPHLQAKGKEEVHPED
jgi:activator of HSP90 ATPase